MLTRRRFIQTGLAAGTAAALGAGFWRETLAAAPARAAAGPYGALGAPDANGLKLPEGFSSRVIARGNLPVAGTNHVRAIFPDGQATYRTPDDGWILVTNSEVPTGSSGDRPGIPRIEDLAQQLLGSARLGAGAGAIRFRPDGSIASAYRILDGTSTNCAGGPTPWGTWLSCEETEDGRVWECDPTGVRPAIVRPALGRFKHEAAAVDPAGRRVYLTEDLVDGGFYRFTPDRYPDLGSGVLEIATVARGGSVSWKRVPDPSGASAATRNQVPGKTDFKRGEGLWFDSGTVYLATTSDGRIHAYDAATETIEVLYDKKALQDPPIDGVDNITVSRSGDLFVCEDIGAETLDIVMITPERTVSRFLTLTGPSATGLPVVNSELTGVVFDPSGTRMYFGSQRGFGFGLTYEVTGPFRAAAAAAGSPADGPIGSGGSGSGNGGGSGEGGEGGASPGFEEHQRDPNFTG